MQPQPDNQTLCLILSGHLKELNWDSFSEADWDVLVCKAQDEMVAPLVYSAISRSEKLSSIPQAARNQLRISYASTWMRNERNLKELVTLLHMFTQAEIPMVALKGICFLLTLYPDIGLRPMGDMDILVPDSKFSEAVQIAKSLGYVDAYPEASPGLKDLLSHEICLQKMGSFPSLLEVHNNLVAGKTFSYAVSPDWFWEQTEPVVTLSSKMEFENLLVLTPTAQVLYGASHAMLEHGGKDSTLCWFYDLDRLIHHYDGRLDWELLLSQAYLFKWGSALGAALDQTCAYFNSPVPNHVRTDLSRQTDRHRQLVEMKKTQPATRILDVYQELLSLNWYGRFRKLLALVIPSPAYMKWRYGLKSSWAVIAWYPFRWWGILKDAFRTVVALAKKTPITRA